MTTFTYDLDGGAPVYTRGDSMPQVVTTTGLGVATDSDMDELNLAQFGIGPGVVDVATFEAALAKANGNSLLVEPGVYVFPRQATTTASVYLHCRGKATFKLADGAIVNTDADADNYHAILQVRGCSWFMVEGIDVDGNRDKQTYPATKNTFGRGSRPFRHNAILEFTPADDNLTRATHINVIRCGFYNGYMNGLALWQTANTYLSDCDFENNTWSGAVGCGLVDFVAKDIRGYRNGVSPIYTTARQDGDRATIQIREYDNTHTVATERIPTIAFPGKELSIGVTVEGLRTTEDNVMSIFVRHARGVTIRKVWSERAGYGRAKASASYYSAGVWVEYVSGIIDDIDVYLPSYDPAYKEVEGVVALAMEGDATLLTADGIYPLTVSNARVWCGQRYDSGVVYTDNSQKRNNIYRGIRTNANVRILNPYVEGVMAGGAAITVVNDGNFTTDNVSNVKIQGGEIRNFLSDYAIQFSRFTGPVGTPTGPLNLVDIQGVTVRDGRSATTGFTRAIVLFDTNWDTILVEQLIVENNNFDCTNSANPSLPYMGTRIRCAAGSKVSLKNNIKGALRAYRVSGGDVNIHGGVISDTTQILDLTLSANVGVISMTGVVGVGLTSDVISITPGLFTVDQLTVTGNTLKGTGKLFAAWPLNGVNSFMVHPNNLSLAAQDHKRRFAAAPDANAHHLGQLAMRTDTDASYMAIGVGGGAADWIAL